MLIFNRTAYLIVVLNLISFSVKSQIINSYSCSNLLVNFDSLKANVSQKEFMKLMRNCNNEVHLFGLQLEFGNLKLENGKKNGAFYHYLKYIQKGGNLNTINELNNLKRFQQKILTKYERKNMKKIDFELIKLLTDIKMRDQYFRSGKFDNDSLYFLQKNYDSLNVSQLKNYIKSHGWPKLEKIRYDFGLVPTLVSIHSNEKDNIYFLNSIIKSAKKHESEWLSVESMMANLCWRFQFNNSPTDTIGYNKLYYVYLNRKKNKIHRKKSELQLYSIVKLNSFSNPDLEIFTCSKRSNEVNRKKDLALLHDFRNALQDFGFKGNIRLIEKSVEVVKDNETPNYRFGYRIKSKTNNL